MKGFQLKRRFVNAVCMAAFAFSVHMASAASAASSHLNKELVTEKSPPKNASWRILTPGFVNPILNVAGVVSTLGACFVIFWPSGVEGQPHSSASRYVFPPAALEKNFQDWYEECRRHAGFSQSGGLTAKELLSEAKKNDDNLFSFGSSRGVLPLEALTKFLAPGTSLSNLVFAINDWFRGGYEFPAESIELFYHPNGTEVSRWRDPSVVKEICKMFFEWPKKTRAWENFHS